MAFQKFTKNLTELVQVLGDVISHEEEHKVVKKKIKDPNAPKRNLSSYMLYYRDSRVDLAAKNPELKAVDMARVIGDKWNALSDKEKQPYVKLAAKDKARFDKEMKAYEMNGSSHKRKAEDEEETSSNYKAEKKKSKKSSSSEKKKSF